MKLVCGNLMQVLEGPRKRVSGSVSKRLCKRSRRTQGKKEARRKKKKVERRK